MKLSPDELRRYLDERLGTFVDPMFRSADDIASWLPILKKMSRLREEKSVFFDRFGYYWTCERSSYNSVIEAYLQWRLLNVISDMSEEVPEVLRRGSIVVRFLPSSCARTRVMQVGQYYVIVVTSGYLVIFKEFARLWFFGLAAGGYQPMSLGITHKSAAILYLTGLKTHEESMSKMARTLLTTLIALQDNEVPDSYNYSVFDEAVIKRSEFELQFGILGTALDGFVLFHEASHVLLGDDTRSHRAIDAEVRADCYSMDLCVIDEARNGSVGTCHLGAPIFFTVESLRVLLEDVRQGSVSQFDSNKLQSLGVRELQLRLNALDAYMRLTLPPKVVQLFESWNEETELVLNTVLWAALNELVPQSIGLYDFVSAKHYGHTLS